jgi:ZIP family zinc transporter
MWQAILWGGVSGSAVLLGALAALYFPIKKNIVGYIMAFGTGVLMGAAAYELLGHSAAKGGTLPAAIGFLSGAVVFTLFELLISRKGGKLRKRTDQKHTSSHAASSTGLAIFIGTLMDAIPESVMIGVSAKEGGISWLLVIAIFISNFPEGLSSTFGLKKSGYSKKRILWMWTSVMVSAALASWAGYAFQARMTEQALAGIAAFAGGGIIAMLASTMLPEAYEEGGPLIGLMAAAGLLVSMLLDQWGR